MERCMSEVTALPYAGIRVVEFTHMVMGPTCGMILADLGAEVIKVEPIDGDKTRNLLGSGAGFFPMFNRNKKSIAVDMKTTDGMELVKKLVATADVISENFKPGAMTKLGLDYETLKKTNPKLIYVSHKGFLPGPYDHRTALDEVVQMMGGLAYMTGPEDRPLRAGSSVNDIMGGVFGAIGAMAALRQRELTGEGQEIQSSLFENNVFLVGQHMMQFAMTGKAAKPMPGRIAAWAIYDVFEVADGEKIFLAVVTDTQWKIFCDVFGFADLYADPNLKLNNQRVQARSSMIPEIKKRLSGFTVKEITTIFEKNGLPFAPITRPEQLFEDPHLIATGGLAPITLTDGPKTGTQTTTPLMPLMMNGKRLGVRLNPPKAGEQTLDILSELGYSADQMKKLSSDGVIA
jgi:crotonobetainyl-CoA:carnitine CoA-transferase CaiB-like acyl-CoA transferase